MHLPYIHHLLSQHFNSKEKEENFPKLVPILVGSTSPTAEKSFGKILASYLANEENVFVISSDFCHWGLRFNYTYYLPSSSSSTDSTHPAAGISLTKKSHKVPHADPPIHESIRTLDHLCVAAIESGSHDAFLKVLRETGNTVCGRHPIGVVMAAMEELGIAGEGKFRFVRYERSSEVERVGDSSVSYVSAFAVV